MNNFQTKCVTAFFDLKSKDPKVTRIAIINLPKPGVAVELVNGDKVFYTMAAIMDPIERLLLAPKSRTVA